MEDTQPLRKHPFFSGIDWEKIDKKQLQPPFKPQVVCLCLECFLVPVSGYGRNIRTIMFTLE